MNTDQRQSSMSRVEANDCLIRDSQKIAGLQHTEKFTHGVESVVETLLPFHIMHRKSVLDEDYDYAKGLGGREDSRDEKSGFRRMLGCRNDVWEAHMLKRASRVRRRLGKLARRVKELEGLELERASDVCELVLHVGDASVGEYALQRIKDAEMKKRVEEEKERRQAERRALEEHMAKEAARRQQQQAARREEEEKKREQEAMQGQEAKGAPGTLKLKLSMPSSGNKLQNPSHDVSLPARTLSDDGTDAMDVVHADSRVMSTELGDETSRQLKDSAVSSSSSGEDARDVATDAVDKPSAQVNLTGSQAGKFKLYAMLNKKKQRL